MLNHFDAKKLQDSLGYVLNVLLGEEQSHVVIKKHIVYSNPQSNLAESVRLCIVPSGFFGQGYGTESSLPALPLKEIDGVPLLYGKPCVQWKDNRLVVYADIIASTFFLVTRYEEIVRANVRDEHRRFPGRESLPYRANFIKRPIVDEYAALLRKWLREIGIDIKEPQRNFSVVLTHDIDQISKYGRILQPLRQVAKTFLGREPFGNIIDSILVPFGAKTDPYDGSELMKLAVDFGNRMHSPLRQSVYFFIADGSNYDIYGKEARNFIKRVRDSGATIGLHASYSAGINPELIIKEKQALEEACGFPVRHNRHHFLMWREVKAGWALSKAGITWDATLGYADVAGFRLGVCRPIELFDPVEMKSFGIEEHPLIVMDGTLDSLDYMGLNEEEAFEYCQELISQTRRYNGEFVALWHNSQFTDRTGNYHPRLYRRLLDELCRTRQTFC